MNKRVPQILKNKYALTVIIFAVYSLFLDDHDLFSMISTKQKLRSLEAEKIEVKNQLDETQYILDRLKYSSEVERFARERKYFKKDDEDVFVLYRQ